MKTRFIVSSVTFRKFLKSLVFTKWIDGSDDFEFEITNETLNVNGVRMSICCKEDGIFKISVDSVDRMIKVLKRFKEQPISLEMNSNDDYFHLTCAVI